MVPSSNDPVSHPASDPSGCGQDESSLILDRSVSPTSHSEITASSDIESSEIDNRRSPQSDFWTGIVAKATQTAKTVSGAAQDIAQTTTQTTTQTTQKLSAAAQEIVEATTKTATETANSMTQTGQAIAQATTETGKTVASSISSGASSLGNSIGESASQAGRAIAHSISETHQGGKAIATSIGQGINTGSSQAGQMVINTVNHATSHAGKAVEWINERSHFQHLTRAIKVDWLMGIIDNVNVDAVETRIQDLQHKHPTATPYQLAGRIMAKKSLIVGGSGLASSMLPGAAAAMVAFDLAATTAIQAEMGYEIAAAYGLDVHDPARKGEILAIFGLALGSSQALKTGFQYLARNIPVAGAVVGASTNAVALYAVGHAACQFYETTLDQETSTTADHNAPTLQPDETTADSGTAQLEATLETVEVQQQHYFEEAIAQQILMDQIFAHVIKAGHPDKTWSQLMPILADLHFNPASIQLIAQYLDHPSDFDTLIAQVKPEFSLQLLSQCQTLVDADGHETPEEKQLLATMTATFHRLDTDT